MSEPLKILLLSDGRPGHFNLSEGIVAAAARLRAVVVTRVEVRRGRWPGAVLATWSNSGMAPARLVKAVYGLSANSLPAAQLVVSAGGDTLAANVTCARLLSATNIFYGSLRRFRASDFGLALTSYAADCRQPNQAFALKPSPAAIAAWSARQSKPPALDTVAILIGGPSGEARFAERDWQALIELVQALAKRSYRCLVANSRRTPNAVSERLAALARLPDGPIASFIDARAPEAANLMSILSRASRAFVTDDSSSMVSEAIAAGLPVVGLVADVQRHSAKEQAYRDDLVRQGWYCALPMSTATDRLLEGLASRTPRREDPVAPIAALLAARLPHLFGP